MQFWCLWKNNLQLFLQHFKVNVNLKVNVNPLKLEFLSLDRLFTLDGVKTLIHTGRENKQMYWTGKLCNRGFQLSDGSPYRGFAASCWYVTCSSPCWLCVMDLSNFVCEVVKFRYTRMKIIWTANSIAQPDCLGALSCLILYWSLMPFCHHRHCSNILSVEQTIVTVKSHYLLKPTLDRCCNRLVFLLLNNPAHKGDSERKTEVTK